MVKLGELLSMKAEVQQLQRMDSAEHADESYTYEWALDAAAVSKVLF